MEEKGDGNSPNKGPQPPSSEARVIIAQKPQEAPKTDDIAQKRPDFLQNDILVQNSGVAPVPVASKVIKIGETKILKHNVTQVKTADVRKVFSSGEAISVAPSAINHRKAVSTIKTDSFLNPTAESKLDAQQSAGISSLASLIQNQPEVTNHQIAPLKPATVIKHLEPTKPRIIKTTPLPVSQPQNPQFLDLITTTTLPSSAAHNHTASSKSGISFEAMINQPKAKSEETTPSVRIIRPQASGQAQQTTRIQSTAVIRKTAIHVKPSEPAAPYPALPSAAEVLSLISDITNEIQKYSQTLNELMQEKCYSNLNVPPITNATEKCQIQDFHNNIYSKSNIPDIVLKNKEIIKKSHKKYEMSLSTVSSTQKYRHVTQLPQFIEKIENSEIFVEPMLQTLYQKMIQVDMKKKHLVIEYQQRREKWNTSNEVLSTYQREIHESVNIWPPEFSKSAVKPNDKSSTQFVAKDVLMEMYLDPSEKLSMLYFDENCFVADPVKEHIDFKKRISWTDQEKQTFIEKYTQHPKEFKKISAALPNKCIKDVIEYYFINRIKLNLKAADTASRKRGRKRIITEGGM